AGPDPAAGGRMPFCGAGPQVTGEGATGLRGWTMSGADDLGVGPTTVDGIDVTVTVPAAPLFADHPLGVERIDHVVVSTDDLLRTSAAIAEATGEPLKRVREAGDLRQGVHRAGGLIVEIVERAGQPTGPATLWGFVLTVTDLDAAASRLGPDVIGEPRDAVQPGRRIATLRREAGLGVPLALMSPHVR